MVQKSFSLKWSNVCSFTLGRFDEVEEFFVVWSGFIFTEHVKRQRPTQRKIMLWNKTDLDGLKKEVTSFSDTFLTAHTNSTNINSLCNDFKSD
jgi:hypothetical protein